MSTPWPLLPTVSGRQHTCQEGQLTAFQSDSHPWGPGHPVCPPPDPPLLPPPPQASYSGSRCHPRASRGPTSLSAAPTYSGQEVLLGQETPGQAGRAGCAGDGGWVGAGALVCAPCSLPWAPGASGKAALLVIYYEPRGTHVSNWCMRS